MAVIRSLVNRTNVLCLTDIGKEAELNHMHVAKALNNKKYPKRVIERFSVDRQPKPANPEYEQPKSTIVIPYNKVTSDIIRRVLPSVDIRVTFRPHTTLKQLLVHPKDPTPSEMKANVVYSIPCRS